MLASQNITLAVGVLAGFGALLFWFSGRRRLSSRFMGSLLALVALMYALRYAMLAQLSWAPQLAFAAVGLAWFHGPLIELYARSSFFEFDGLRWRRTLAPAAIVGTLALVLHGCLYATTDWASRVAAMQDADGPFRVYFAGMILAVAAFCSYNLWRIVFWVRMYRRRYPQYRAGSASGGVREMYAFLALCAAWLATPLITELLVGLLGFSRPWFLLPVSAFAFVPLLFLALRRAMGPAERLPDSAMDAPADAASGAARSTLPPQRLQFMVDGLRQALEQERVYLDEELSLMDLARELGVSRHHLSEAISAGFGTNFYGLINRYRAAEAAELLRDPDLGDETILSIAYRAGFRSKAVFNRVFKSETGATPGEFRAAAKKIRGPKTAGEID